MKKRLYIFLSIFGVILLGACSKSDEIPGGGEPTIEKEWIIFDDVVMTSESQVFDMKYSDGYVKPATIGFRPLLFHGTQYLLNFFKRTRIIAVSGGGYLSSRL